MGVGIQVDKLNAWFGKTQALYDINMTVAANHATAVIGPSGCGKSTFVRCLNRMHETVPEARATGRVRIGELDVYNGTMIGGLSAGTGADLTQLGFPVTAGLTWSSQDITQTLVEYPPGDQAGAKVVQHVMPGAALRQVSGLVKIRIVLGTDGNSVTGASASTGQGTASGNSVTAAQYACS